MRSNAFRRYYLLFAAFLAALSIAILFRDGLNRSAGVYLDHLGHKDDKIDDGEPSSDNKEPSSDNEEPPSDKEEPSSPLPPPLPKRLPEPTWIPPPISDPFPALTTALSPPVPWWNIPEPHLYAQYNLSYAPPLLIGFTRSWPMLLQTVVSYITAGWPPEQIHVVENTGVQRANELGNLTLQNPFYLNHSQLKKLGVNVIQTPVLMSFAQLQNFYLHLSLVNGWPQYFWGHMDVLVLSYEDGMEDVTPRAGEAGYKTVYELCLKGLREALDSKEPWSQRLFAYDHLTLTNREAYEDIGGWDTLIPYYMTDCDFYSRLHMRGWKEADALAGIIADVSTVLDDFGAFYRLPDIEPSFRDPNPGPPEEDPPPKADERRRKRGGVSDEDLDYWIRIRQTADRMFHYKHGSRGRNTWQTGQHGGQREPYFYHSRGVEEGIQILTQAGKDVFAAKWGHRDCDLGQYRIDDQWVMEKDWEVPEK